MWGGDSFNDFTAPRNPSYHHQHTVNRHNTVPLVHQQPSSTGICKISNLQPGIVKEKIVGVTIAKEEARCFPSKKDPSTERHVMSFTIRDSPTDFINATCWGNREFIHDLSLQFHIGDVVELTNAGIQSKPMDGSDEKFHPWTPSPYMLNISENRTTVALYTGWDTNEYVGFSHIPIKPGNEFYTLGDINSNGSNLNGENVNILAVVRSIGPVKEVNSKNNKPLKRCEVKLLDETNPSFTIILWDAEQILLAQNWTPKDTVIFGADVRVKYDDYRKTMVATATSKTILTVNPDTREAHTLYQYAQTVELPAEEPVLQISFSEPSSNVDLSSIKTVYTVAQCKDRQVIKEGGGGVEHAILYVHITAMDIDSEQCSVIYRCAKCRQRIDLSMETCVNQDCPQGSRFDLNWETTEKTANFEIRVSLSDHTGTLESCYVNGDVCETWLQTSVEEYLAMTVDQKTQLKWQYLLEQCKVYIKMNLPTYDFRKATVRILRIEKANPQEAAKFL